MTNTQRTHSPKIRPIRRAVAALALLVPLGAFAVLSASPAGAGDGRGSDSIHVTTPTDGAVVPTKFPVRIKTNVPIGPPDTGRHHIHLYWDGERDEGKYDIVYKKRFTKKGLAPGTHMLDAVIANADHSTTDTHEVVQVEVSKDAPQPTPRRAPSGDSNDGVPGY
jgi:hypothetical protein